MGYDRNAYMRHYIKLYRKRFPERVRGWKKRAYLKFMMKQARERQEIAAEFVFPWQVGLDAPMIHPSCIPKGMQQEWDVDLQEWVVKPINDKRVYSAEEAACMTLIPTLSNRTKDKEMWYNQPIPEDNEQPMEDEVKVEGEQDVVETVEETTEDTDSGEEVLEKETI